jgi:hypothetical protein
MKEELLKGLTEEQKAKIKNCKSGQEILEIAKQEGTELNDDQLEAVSGGGCGDVNNSSATAIVCPSCGSYDVETITVEGDGAHLDCVCKKCRHTWSVPIYNPYL